MIGVVDYGIGNLGSVVRALEAVGGEPQLVTSTKGWDQLRGLVLPGVGNFGDCCRALHHSGMWQAVRDWATASQRPFFGVCVGQQMLFERSQEAPDVSGLGVLKGEVVKFSTQAGLKVPQIGWNSVRRRTDSPYFEGIEDGDFVYFVHSYYVVPNDPSCVALETDYGVTFPAAIARGRLLATQFHPEKSQQTGLRIWRNFVTQVTSP